MRRLLALLALLTLPLSVYAQPQFDGVFASEGLNCECNPQWYVFRASTQISGYATPSTLGTVIRTVQPDSRLDGSDWSDILNVTLRSRTGTVAKPATLTGLSSYGATNYIAQDAQSGTVDSLTLGVGDPIEELGTQTEGWVYFRYRGTVYLGDIAPGVVTWSPGPLQQVVYFQLTPKAGLPAAWIQARFDNTDDPSQNNLVLICSAQAGCSN